MSDFLFNLFIVSMIFIFVVVFPVMLYVSIKADNKHEAECIAKGGEWHTGRDIRLCLKPEAVIK